MVSAHHQQHIIAEWILFKSSIVYVNTSLTRFALENNRQFGGSALKAFAAFAALLLSRPGNNYFWSFRQSFSSYNDAAYSSLPLDSPTEQRDQVKLMSKLILYKSLPQSSGTTAWLCGTEECRECNRRYRKAHQDEQHSILTPIWSEIVIHHFQDPKQMSSCLVPCKHVDRCCPMQWMMIFNHDPM